MITSQFSVQYRSGDFDTQKMDESKKPSLEQRIQEIKTLESNDIKNSVKEMLKNLKTNEAYKFADDF